MNEDETYESLADKMLKNDNIDSLTKYVNDFCNNRIINKKEIKICYFPPCLNKISNDNSCDIHKNKKHDF